LPTTIRLHYNQLLVLQLMAPADGCCWPAATAVYSALLLLGRAAAATDEVAILATPAVCILSN